jgi:hypothetical protein
VIVETVRLWVIAIAVVLPVAAPRLLVAAFVSEFAALARADDPEGTVLGRIRCGSGEKK